MGDAPSYYSLTARKVIFFAAIPLFALLSLGTIALLPFLWIYLTALKFIAKRTADRDLLKGDADAARAIPRTPIGRVD